MTPRPLGSDPVANYGIRGPRVLPLRHLSHGASARRPPAREVRSGTVRLSERHVGNFRLSQVTLIVTGAPPEDPCGTLRSFIELKFHPIQRPPRVTPYQPFSERIAQSDRSLSIMLRKLSLHNHNRHQHPYESLLFYIKITIC